MHNSTASDRTTLKAAKDHAYPRSSTSSSTRYPPHATRSQGENQPARRAPTETQDADTRPTPQPTGDPSPSTTVHINSEQDFSLLLPDTPGELISDAEADGVSFCAPGSTDPHCAKTFPDGFVRAAAISRSDDGAWIQITGCLDSSKFQVDTQDAGGQFDVRFPNGAQCTFGGYAASFIELVEPALNRFCLRCCQSANDQVNCNSHRDRQGCINAVPGVYDFPELGVSCS